MTINFEVIATKVHMNSDAAREGFAHLLPNGVSPLTGSSEKQIAYGEDCRARFLFMQAADILDLADEDGLARALTMVDAAAAEIDQPREPGSKLAPAQNMEHRLARRIAAVRKMAKNDSARFWIDWNNGGFFKLDYTRKELGGLSI